MCAHCGFDNNTLRPEDFSRSGSVLLTSCHKCGHILKPPIRLACSNESAGDTPVRRERLLD